MSDQKPATTLETCGNCRWGRRADQIVGPEAAIECNGIPPSVTVMGWDQASQPVIALLRPKQPAKTPRCGLWDRQPSSLLVN